MAAATAEAVSVVLVAVASRVFAAGAAVDPETVAEV
jgi:hypothetical protein